MKEIIDEMMEKLPQLTKEEADFIETVLKWDSEKKAAFMIAKRIFESKDEGFE